LTFGCDFYPVRTLRPEEELDTYLDVDNPKIGIKEDAIEWWYLNDDRFPNLSSVALELLTIPVSSVASERTVSCLNRILTYDRTRLTAKNVNMLVILNSKPLDFWSKYIGVVVNK